MTGIFIQEYDGSLKDALAEMSIATRAWNMRAARGECGWVCSDCCCVFPEGMPADCPHGDARCTGILTRDLAEANAVPHVLR